jgi:hypothetical protein
MPDRDLFPAADEHFVPYSEPDLIRLEQLATPSIGYPWTSYIEDRDHMSGSHFIMVGREGGALDEDLDMYWSSRDSFQNLQDLIALVRNHCGDLIRQLRGYRSGSPEEVVSGETLMLLDLLLAQLDPTPWVVVATGEEAGDANLVIRTAAQNDIRITRDSDPAERSLLEFIALSVSMTPWLIREIRVGKFASWFRPKD